MAISLAGAAVIAVVAGATYTGTHAGGGSVQFTVAADGSRLTSYSIRDVPGDTCTFTAGGAEGEWEGTPIVSDAFDYRLYDALRFAGRFDGAQSAAGTLRMSNGAVPGVKPACDTGTVTWTAATTASPAASPPAGTATGAKAAFRTTVELRRRGRAALAGRLASPDRQCRSRRTVTLRRGSRRIAAARSASDGTFVFRRSARTHGGRVRARVAARTLATVVCSAGASRRVKG